MLCHCACKHVRLSCVLNKLLTYLLTYIFRLKCTEFNFGWGYAPDPAGGDYSAPAEPLAGREGASRAINGVPTPTLTL